MTTTTKSGPCTPLLRALLVAPVAVGVLAGAIALGSGAAWADPVFDASTADVTSSSSEDLPIAPAGDFSGLKGPEGIAVDIYGNIYVADTNNQRVVRYDSTGHNLTVILDKGLSVPRGVAVDKYQNVYIADSYHHRVVKVTYAGQQSTYADGFEEPAGIAIDSRGNIYIADRGNLTRDGHPGGGVTRIDPNTGRRTNVGRTDIRAFGVAVDAQDNIYIADQGNLRDSWSQVVRIGPDDPNLGTVISKDSAYSVTVDGRGVVYYVNGVDTVTEAAPTPTGYDLTAHTGEFGFQHSNGIVAKPPMTVGRPGQVYATDFVQSKVYPIQL